MVKSFKVDVLSVSHSLSDEGLTLETSDLKLSTVANVRFQLSC